LLVKNSFWSTIEFFIENKNFGQKYKIFGEKVKILGQKVKIFN